MAGKSTYLRQVALLTVMAQTGSFVPADKARIGICDKVFTRIGASDDLARGVSTFLAEMAETANILNNASHRSLVILDEVGRGTSTNDGLALAWATVEHLHGGGPGPAPGTGSPGLVPESPLQTAVPRPPPPATPKTLFATHYRELTDLPTLLPRCRNYSFQVREHKDRVIFLRRIKPGPADKSYGIAVAKLAGIPEPVIRRARELIDSLARAEQQNLAQALDLAIAADRAASSGRQSPPDVHQSEVPAHPVLSRLRSVDLNSLSPLQALNLLAELQRLTVEA
jgi:DNA mismatch repair protein MutS